LLSDLASERDDFGLSLIDLTPVSNAIATESSNVAAMSRDIAIKPIAFVFLPTDFGSMSCDNVTMSDDKIAIRRNAMPAQDFLRVNVTRQCGVVD
jgi:hypothetical protein